MIRLSVIDPSDLGLIRGSEDLTLDELYEVLSTPTAEYKSAQPLVVGAVFSGTRRLKSECLTRNVIPLDLDDGSMGPMAVAKKLDMLGLEAVIHATASHTAIKPKLRAFVPLSRPLTAEEWPRAQAWIRQTWNADPNAIDLPRISYAPVPIVGYLCLRVHGKPLDVDTLPQASTAMAVRPSQSQSSSRSTLLAAMFLAALPPMGHRHGFYLALSGFMAKQQLPVSEAKAIVVQMSTESGAPHEITKRLHMVDETYTKHAAGGQVAGEQALTEAMSHAVGTGAQAIVLQAARIMLGMPKKTEQERRPAAPPRPSATNRSSGEKLLKPPMNRLAYDLSTLEEWKDVLAYDTFSQARTVIGTPPVRLDASTGKWTDKDTLRIKQWFEWRGEDYTIEKCEQAIDLVCDENKVNLVGQWLDSLPASTGAIEQLADTLGLTKHIERKMLRKWLLSAVARAFNPGTFLKSALVIQGVQDAGKTGVLKALFGNQYYRSVNSDMSDDKRIGELVAGAWVVELEEGHATTKTDKAAMKRVLSLQCDTYRPAYGHHVVERPRTCVFAVTTNADEFLDDETGNVRYYCIEAQEYIDLGRVEGIREAVWAEARDAYRAGEACYLTDTQERTEAAERAKLFETSDVLDTAVEQFLAGKPETTIPDLVRHVSIAHDHMVKAGRGSLEMRLPKILRRLGCTRSRTAHTRAWKVPDKLQKKLRAVK